MRVPIIPAAFLFSVHFSVLAAAAPGPRDNSGRAPNTNAPEVSNPGVWQDIDEGIKRVQKGSADLRRFVDRAKKINARSSMSVSEQLVAIRDSRKKEYEACLTTTTFKDLLPSMDRSVAESYVACSSLTTGQDKCSLLSIMSPASGGTSGPGPDFGGCRQVNACLQMNQSILTGKADADQRCRACWEMNFQGQPEAAAQACQLLLKKLPAEEVCPKVLALDRTGAAGPKHADEMDTCSYEASTYRGLAQPCADAAPNQILALGRKSIKCKGEQLFLKAHAARSLGLCGENWLCRYMMSKDPRACELLLKPVRQKFCDTKNDLRTNSDKVVEINLPTDLKGGGSVAMATPEDLRLLHDDIQAALSSPAMGDPKSGADRAFADLQKFAAAQAPSPGPGAKPDAKPDPKAAKPFALTQLFSDVFLLRANTIRSDILGLEKQLDGLADKKSDAYTSRKEKVDDLRDSMIDKINSMQEELTP